MTEELFRPDLYSLDVFQTVAKLGSFTGAARELGVTQSAVTRQIQALESRMGTSLMDRTTRRVRLNAAGESLLATAEETLRTLDRKLEWFAETHLGKAPSVAVGFSHSIPHAHLPGYLKQFRRIEPSARLCVRYDSGARLREALLEGELDLAIFTVVKGFPRELELLHSFDDDFVVVTPTKEAPDDENYRNSWLALDSQTNAGKLLRTWIRELQPNLEPSVELNSFDQILSLVGLGLGSSIVPRRALRLYGSRLGVRVVESKKSFCREIGVFARASRERQTIVEAFVQSILFGWKGGSRAS
ncbi:MAG: LysR family transcriptional regulator [Verrucomicrobiota bacterium]